MGSRTERGRKHGTLQPLWTAVRLWTLALHRLILVTILLQEDVGVVQSFFAQNASSSAPLFASIVSPICKHRLAFASIVSPDFFFSAAASRSGV